MIENFNSFLVSVKYVVDSFIDTFILLPDDHKFVSGFIISFLFALTFIAPLIYTILRGIKDVMD